MEKRQFIMTNTMMKFKLDFSTQFRIVTGRTHVELGPT